MTKNKKQENRPPLSILFNNSYRHVEDPICSSVVKLSDEYPEMRWMLTLCVTVAVITILTAYWLASSNTNKKHSKAERVYPKITNRLLKEGRAIDLDEYEMVELAPGVLDWHPIKELYKEYTHSNVLILPNDYLGNNIIAINNTSQ